TGQGGTINMRVRLDGSNASDQLVINGGQATGKTWLAFTNVGNSNLGVATSGQGSGYLLRTDAWSYPVLRLKRLGLSKTFRRLVVTLTRRYGASLIHLDASAECLPGFPTFDW
ncbi:DUF5983 family protein, partial [Escherichia coli]|uniref:DUF5983 family protein n=1 Tax=Escherichia coli TaxID=562 RepID=UPI001F12ADA8